MRLINFVVKLAVLKLIQLLKLYYLVTDKLDKNRPWEYDSWDEINFTASLSSGGGTNFHPVFDFVNTLDTSLDVVVYFTDCKVKFPKNTLNYPVIWLVKGSEKNPWRQKMSIAINYHITEFYNYLKFEKGYSQHTVNSYLFDLKILFAFEADIKKINSQKIQILIMQQNAKGKSPKSIKRLVASIKNYVDYLYKINKIKNKIIFNIKTPKLTKILPKTLSYEAIMSMINNCTGSNKQRDSAIISTLYACGLRVSELVGLTINDIGFKEGFIKILGKGNKERYTPIGNNALRFLHNYLTMRTDYNKAIFVNSKFTRLSARSIQNIVAKKAELANIEFRVTPHMLRHSAASHLLQSSGDLRATQEYLGHKSIVSTQIYTHLDFMALANVYDKCHPHAKK